jgi:AcrR family transcriptional regulator
VPRAGLTPDRVVEEAARLANQSGLDTLTLAAVADALGVRVPSLYKHVAGMPELRRRLALRAKRRLTEVLTRAAVGRSRGDALRSVAGVYRDWAREHPADYTAAQAAPMPGDVEDEQASADVTGVVYDVLAGYGVDDDTLIDATRSLRAGLHGFVALEAAGGFALPRSLTDSLDWWLDSLDTALAASTTRQVVRSHQTKS